MKLAKSIHKIITISLTCLVFGFVLPVSLSFGQSSGPPPAPPPTAQGAPIPPTFPPGTAKGISAPRVIFNKEFFPSQDPTKRLATNPNNGRINGARGNPASSDSNQQGVIANLGSVSLESGKAATLDFNGDNLINFAITEEVTGTAKDSAGKIIDQNIDKKGLIDAEGGLVSLSARQSGEIIKNVVNQEGVNEAGSVIKKDGRVFLSIGGSQKNIQTIEDNTNDTESDKP